MSVKSGTRSATEKVAKDIRCRTRRQHSSEEKIRIVLKWLHGEERISKLYRRKGIAPSLDHS